MFNVLLDPLPEEYKGFRINSDFRIGIQIIQATMDADLSRRERAAVCFDLLYGNDEGLPLPDPRTAQEGISWFINGWYTDNDVKRKTKQQLMSFINDQWRIYAAFLAQYGIDLNTARIHFWAFEGLLSSLDNCTFTKVMEIRSKKIDPKTKGEAREAILAAKQQYAIEEPESDLEKEQMAAAREAFLSQLHINRHEE